MYIYYPLFLSDFNETWISRQIFEKSKTSNFMKIRPVRAELFHMDGRTWRSYVIFALRNFANESRNSSGHSQSLKGKYSMIDEESLGLRECINQEILSTKRGPYWTQLGKLNVMVVWKLEEYIRTYHKWESEMFWWKIELMKNCTATLTL